MRPVQVVSPFEQFIDWGGIGTGRGRAEIIGTQGDGGRGDVFLVIPTDHQEFVQILFRRRLFIAAPFQEHVL